MPAKRPIEERLFEKVNKTSQCWLWLGTTTKSGHGQIRYDGLVCYTHIVSWFLATGEWPDYKNGDLILHKCDVPNCVNPDHLYAGNRLDNNHDMLSRHPGLVYMKLTQAQVDEIRSLGSSYSQADLASKYCVSQSTIWRILNYHRRSVRTAY